MRMTGAGSSVSTRRSLGFGAQRARAGRPSPIALRASRVGSITRKLARDYSPALVALVAFVALVAAASLAGTASLLGRSGPAARAERPAVGRSFAQPLPLTLASAASSSMGASSRSFWPVRSGESIVARGGGLVSTFTPSGARVSAPGGTLELSLASVSRGARASQIAPSRPGALASQVSYRHGAIAELYQAGPYGLEQSFVVSEPPVGGGGALTLAIRLGGGMRAQADGSQGAFYGRRGAPALAYGALSARDAAGRELPRAPRPRGR